MRNKEKMRIRQHAEITIKATAEEIWDYANDSNHWTASNPKEHLGLIIYTSDGRARKGAEFYQKESVAGIVADLHGRFLHFERPKFAVWEGIATYKVLGGLFGLSVLEGGTIRLEKDGEGVRMSHDMFIDFPDTLFGRLVFWVFKNILNGKEAVYNHGYRELTYFKKQLETTASYR